MLNSVYMTLTITDYGNGLHDCFYFQAVDGKNSFEHDMNYDKACRLMWELKKAGATKELSVNQFDPHICHRTVSYWARH